MKFIKRLGGFAANGVITGLATLVSIALILRFFGESGWATFAVAQAAGMLLAVLVGFGWPVLGPARIAMLSGSQQKVELLTSARVRAGVLVGVVVLCCAALLPGFFPGSSDYLPVTIAYASTGLSSLWFFVGTGESWASFFRDAVPRAVASVVAPFIALLGPTQLLLGAAIFAGNLLSFLLVVMHACNESPAAAKISPQSPLSVRKILTDQWHGLLTGGVSSVYMTVPTIAVGMLAPSTVGRFALGDKMVRLSSTALLPLTQVLQGWVPAASTQEERRSRVNRALLIMTIIGVSGGGLLAAGGPLVAEVYSSGHITFDHALSIPMGVILACTLLSQVAGVGCLGAFGDFRAISASATIGAVIGLPLLLVAALLWGVIGAMWSVAISETLVLGYQYMRVRAHLAQM